MKEDKHLVLTKNIVRLSLNELKKHSLINKYKVINNNKELKQTR